MKRIWIPILASFALFFHLMANLAGASEQVAVLTDFSGTIIVQSRGDWSVKPEKGLPLYSFDKIVTRTGTAVVTFNDGAVIEIRANSNLLIEEQEKAGTVTRNLRLLLGKIMFKTGGGSKTQTNLQTPTSVAGLRGTAGTLSIGLDGKAYVQFTEGGTSYTVGDFISGVAKDVPPELADLNPAQRAAFVAAAAADQAKNAAEAAKEGRIADPQAALAAAKAAEAAALEAKTAAEAMLSNPDPALRQQAMDAIDAADKALEAAKEAAKKAIEAGATPEGPETYTPADDQKGPGFDVEPPTTVVYVSTTLTTTITSTSTTSPASTTSTPTPTTTIALSGSMDPEAGFLTGGGSLGENPGAGTFTVTGVIKEDASPPYHGPVGGTMSDGSVFQGYLSGLKGSFLGIFDSIFVTPEGDVGFLYSSLLDDTVDETGSLSATGVLKKSGTYGNIKVPRGQSLKSLMGNHETDANSYMDEIRVPRLSHISINDSGLVTGLGGVIWDSADSITIMQTNSIELSNDTLLGVWRYSLTPTDHFSFNPRYENESPSTTEWTVTFGYHESGSLIGEHFMLGDLEGEYLAGHLKVTGILDYLDANYMGEINFEFQGYYGEDAHAAVAGGTMNLVPLAFSGEAWGSLKYFDYGYLEEGGSASGLIGGTDHTLFSGAPTPILMMGSASYEEGPPSTPMLLYGSGWYFDGGSLEGESAADTGKFKGYTVGIWRDGLIDAEVMALYIDADGNAGYISGNPKGNYNDLEGQSIWRISGELAAVQKGFTSVAPGELNESIAQDAFYGFADGWGEYPQTGSGDFWDSGVRSGRLSVYTAAGDPIRIHDQSWGIWNAGFGGEYDGSASNDWEVNLGGYYEEVDGDYYEGYWIGQIQGFEWGEHDIRGIYTGKALTERHLISIDGKVLGSHWSDDGGYWQAAGIGDYTMEPLAWNGWGYGSLYCNNGGHIEERGETYGLLGGIHLPWTGSPSRDFVALGMYYTDSNMDPFLAGSEMIGEISEQENLTGVLSAIVKDRSIIGGAAALYNTPDGMGGILLSNDVSGRSYMMSVGYVGDDYYMEDFGMWELTGTFTPREMTTADINRTPDNFDDVNYGNLTATLSGHFGGGQGVIMGQSSINTESMTQYYTFSTDGDQRPWGIYSLMFDGNDGDGYGFTEKPTGNPLWSAGMTGEGDFGLGESLQWSAVVSGTWTDEGIVTGILGHEGMDGFFYNDSGDEMGIISGIFFGISSSEEGRDDGYWIGQSIGSWEWSTGDGALEPSSLYSFDGAEIVYIGEDPASIGIVPRGESKFYFLALGDYSVTGESSGPYLQHTRVYGSIEDNGGTGRFEGVIGSVWKDGTIDGWITTIRTTSDGSAGILLGDAAGGYFSDLGKWKAKGDLSYVPLAYGLNPDNIEFEEKDLAWTGIGSLVDGAIQVASSKGSSLSIPGQNWGVWQTLQAGTYTGAPSDTWTISLTHQSPAMNHWVEVDGSNWSAEKLSAKAAGAWVNWDRAVTGLMGGGLKGTFNPTDATWQAVTSGAHLETSQFMDMIARGRFDALQKLNIPCMEVGRATLAGSGNLLNVTMKDVTFLGYSTGANPRIWATNNVNGTFSGTPSPGHSVTLNSTSGNNLSANFSVNNWANNKWGAGVAGSGTLKRTDLGGTVNLNFQGAAAGSYTGTSSGSFTGTGAGTAK